VTRAIVYAAPGEHQPQALSWTAVHAADLGYHVAGAAKSRAEVKAALAAGLADVVVVSSHFADRTGEDKIPALFGIDRDVLVILPAIRTARRRGVHRRRCVTA
jgi:hypothetical protein